MKNTRKLGESQLSCLKHMMESHGQWYPGCGWTWGPPSAGERIMESLVKRGLATALKSKAERGIGYTTYTLTEAGRQVVFANSAWHKLKYGG